MVRYRLWLIGSVALLNAWLDASASAGGSDFFALEPVARELFSATWFHALDEAWIQVGPLGLLWPAANDVAHEITGLSAELVFSVTVYLGVTLGSVALVRALYRGSGSAAPPWVELFAGLAVVVAGVGWAAVSSGQPFEVVVGVLWICAAATAVRDRPLAAGALLGVACAIKLNAALGLPLLLLVPGSLRKLGATGVAVTVAVTLYAPFFLWGDAGTFDFTWSVSHNSFVSYLVAAGSTFTWEMRLVQSAVAIALGAVAATTLRRSVHVVWAVPFAIATLRVVTDPLAFGYYWLAAETIAVAGVALLFKDASTSGRLLLGVGYVALGLALLVPNAGSSIRVALAVLLMVYVGIGGRRRSPSVEEARAPV